ncbi:thioesterase II family protein [Thermoactinospora rubra]|uniref:thioesterase II family protein n=1 Tax=Thermoactinospora rubra TaxID=1088767 RepID=UPI001301E8D0|nr:alpha/beta fold hydrolase [Thermoactinospora rubra]
MNLTPARGGRTNVVCLPYAGGGVAAFHDWPARLPAELNLWAVRPPGRESRLLQPPIRDLRTMVAELTPCVVPLTRRPYAVFGHSMGALLAYELVRALVGRGLPEPVWLVVSGHAAPHVAVPGELHKLPERQLIQRLREYGATPQDLLATPDLLRLFLPTIRADLAVAETYRYRPGPRLSCPVAAYRGSDDPEVTRAQCAAWAELTSGPCVVRDFPGGHFFLEDGRDDMLGHLSSLLAGTHNPPQTAAPHTHRP